MKKKMRWGALCGAICLAILCVSADTSAKPLFRNQSDRIDELEKQNLELKKQIAELDLKIEILARRVNECSAGTNSGNSFSEENLTNVRQPPVPGLEVVRIRPGSQPSAASAAPATPPKRGTFLVTSSNDDLVTIVEHNSSSSSSSGALPGTNYVPPPDPAGGSSSPPVLTYSPTPAASAPAAPAAAPAAPSGSSSLSSGEAAAYKQIKGMWDSNQTDLAVPLMQEYLKRHARGAHEDEVAYRLGDYYYSQGEYAKAVECFRRLREFHYTSNLAPDAIYKLGLCYLELGKQKEAEEALEEVESIYPFSNAAPMATKKLESCCR